MTATTMKAPAVTTNLHALEQGLGVHTTKLGPGDKEEAYAMAKTRARWFVTGIVAALIILSVLVGVYAGLFNDERIRRIFLEKKTMEKLGEEKVDAIRLGIAIHQQEAEREHQEYDTKRAMRRIISVVGRKFEELLADTTDKAQLIRLKEAKATITGFVDDELKDFEKEKRAYDAGAKKRLEKLAKTQEESLRELLKTVSGVKMDALEDMLEEVFAAGQRAPLLEVTDETVDEIEELADSLYEGKTDIHKGRERLETLRMRIAGDLPEEITKGFADARDADDLAQVLDDLVEVTKLARGKKEIAVIEENWRKNIDKAREDVQELQQDNTDDEEQDVYDEEIKQDVDALLAIHKLVAEGKVPVYLLDFEAIDMKDLQQNGDENDENENNDQGEGEQQQGDENQQQEGDQGEEQQQD